MFKNKISERNPVDFNRSWEFVTVPGRFRPARHKYNIDTGIYSIALVSLVVPQPSGGIVRHPDVLHFRAQNIAELRAGIEAAFPEAVFSQANPEQDIKTIHAAEVKAEKAQVAAQQKAVKDAEDVVAAHRQAAYAMTETQIFEATKKNIINFMQIEPWKSWFSQPENHGFLTFPNDSNQNRMTLVAICDSKGYIIPLNGEIDECLRIGLANNLFYRKNKYKRSEVDEYHSVKPFTGRLENPRISELSDEVIQAAHERLRKALPPGIVSSPERIAATAKELGFSNQLLNAVLGRLGSWKERDGLAGSRESASATIAKSDFAGKSAAQMKQELARIRPPVDPALRRRGY